LLALRNDGPCASVIADMQMPGMDGVQFLGRARNLALNAMRVLIAEKMDIVCLVSAVNDRCVFRLLVKSRQPAELKGAVIAALDRYRERVRIALPAHFSHSAPGEKFQLANTVDPRLASTAGSWRSSEGGMRGLRAPFQVVWVGANGTALEGDAGLQCLAGLPGGRFTLMCLAPKQPATPKQGCKSRRSRDPPRSLLILFRVRSRVML
jgi:CheY-like chemotaxis protein